MVAEVGIFRSLGGFQTLQEKKFGKGAPKKYIPAFRFRFRFRGIHWEVGSEMGRFLNWEEVESENDMNECE